MAYKPDSIPSRSAAARAIVVVAAALTAAALWWGNGFAPVWWLMWLAPIPILWLAPRVRASTAFAAAAAAYVAGGCNLLGYYRGLGVPVVPVAILLLAPGFGAGLGVLLFRGLSRHGRWCLAVWAWPCAWTAFEFARSPIGSYLDIANTQLSFLPVEQLAALTGAWGVAFVVMLFPAVAVAAGQVRTRWPGWGSRGPRRGRAASGWRGAATPGPAPVNGRERWTLVLPVAMVLAAALGFGVWRLRATPPSAVLRVGLAVSDLPQNLDPHSPAGVSRLIAGYAAQVSTLAARGAQVVVMPEKIAPVSGALSVQANREFETAAKRAGVYVAAGLLHATATGVYNEARLYGPSGVGEAVYRKQHLIPGLEAAITPGTALAVERWPVGVVGIAICKDLDFTNPARRYGQRGIGLLLVPAWDFGVDGAWHARLAFVRGIENGYSVARAAKQGLLTVTDDRGRMLAERRSSADVPFATLVAPVPVRHDATLYTRWGDWFAWLDAGGLAALAIVCLVGSRERRRPFTEPEDPSAR